MNVKKRMERKKRGKKLLEKVVVELEVDVEVKEEIDIPLSIDSNIEQYVVEGDFVNGEELHNGHDEKDMHVSNDARDELVEELVEEQSTFLVQVIPKEVLEEQFESQNDCGCVVTSIQTNFNVGRVELYAPYESF